MSLTELYTKGAQVWIPDADLVWKGATLEEDFVSQKKLKVCCDDGESTVVDVKLPDGLPPLRNPDILVGENDLTSLSYLHEPAVLYNLQVRFCERNYIYTYCGIVLVAINPYYTLPIYDNDTIHAYSGQDMANMDPHIFAVAEEAFKRVSRFEENQSIIVSGESGAGKTVSAKYAMRYFATVCGAEAETQIEKRVLASNPIMEAFGNAKTTRNDNSSRFGKYIQIGFSKNNTIMGANMRTYLLEKSRVVFQATEERNYHIFYQLCSSHDCPEYSELKLDHPDRFSYANQGSAPTVDSIDDAGDLIATREAFCLMGINELRQMEIFRILSGILHMGNIVVKSEERSADNCSIPKSDEHMELMAEMLGIDLEQMRYWLCHRKIVTATEVLNKPLTAAQACFSRDALAKHIYSQLFNWIVTELNKILSATYKMTKFIGVLDIYGFETFEVNSFEQFCINYANEKLQQQFCLHVFKLEQEEYVREEIEWSFIDFHDNQPCIDLIEGRLGILDLLDEECRMPSASDRNWCLKLYDKHTTSKHFVKPRMSQTSFVILHFADRVEYQMDGFVEKNRDTVLEEHINILKASQYELVAELFQDKQGEASTPGRTQRSVTRPAREPPKSSSQQRQMRKTVGSQFRESLTLLMETLFKTTPHYVRCIKPNDSKMSFSFDPKRAVQQLRACGVLETIRISAAGYPSRWTYSEFFQRYRVLARSREIQRSNMRKTCENILHKLIQDRDKYQFGKSKIFFRAGQVAYLEKLRSDRLRECGILIQKYIRGWLAKMRYTKIRRTALLVQTYGRGMLARRQAMFLKRTQCATLIQATWRRFHQQQLYKRVIRAAISIQAFARGVFGRERFISMRANAKAVIIQRHVRGWLARIRYRKVRHGFIMLQAHVRRHAAKKELKKLKIEARSVEHMKNVARGLENKVIELQQKLTEKNKEVAVLREDQLQLIEMKNEVTRLRAAVQSAKLTSDRLAELELMIERLKAELEKEKTEKASCVQEMETIKKDKDQLVGDLTNEKMTLKEELEKANELIKLKEVQQEVVLREKVEEARQLLLSEFNIERSHHQKMVKDFTRLQQRFENLKGDMQVLASPPGGAPVYKRQGSGSAEATGSDEAPEGREKDPGYGSGRRKEKFVTKEEEVDWDGQELDSISEAQSEEKESSNLSLVSRLQMRIKQLEWERALLRREVDRKDAKIDGGGKSGDDLEKEIYESIKLQDLETENESIRKDLMDLQKAVVDDKDFMEQGLPHAGKSAKLLLEQFEAMNEELVRRREECIHLRTVLASSARTAKDTEDRDLSSLNEDGELEMAYKTQKDLNKLLANEIQRLQKTSGDQEKDLRSQIDELRKDNNRQQKLIGQNLTMTPQAKMEATMQHEITRLTSENLDLREQIDKLQEQIKKLKKVLKIYAKRLKSTEGEWRLSRLMSRSFSFASEVQEDLEREMAVDENMPAVKHYHQREYSGMFEYRKEEEMLLVKNLVMDLRPRIAAQQLPGLPSYVLFMCIRHTDYMNDDDKVRSLLTNTINGIKKVVKKHQEDLEMITLWLANTCRLLHSLKQYSGEKVFQTSNTPKQNEHCLRNFDLSEYRQILSDLAVWIFQGLIKLTEAQIHPTIVGAILEHEAIAGLSAGKPTGLRGRVLSNARRENVDDKNKDVSLDSLIKALENLYRVLNVHAVDPELINQIFRQVFYFICANSLNNLLLRKDMCHWTKGMQMRYNLSHLEQWLRDHKMQETGGVQMALDPIVQASQLLQARKTDNDIDSICDMCSRLTTSQIIKILNLYTPVNEFEERVPISFIRKIQDKLTSRHDSTQTLLMDTKFLYAITFPFNPSSVGLDTIAVPVEWGLGFLKRL